MARDCTQGQKCYNCMSSLVLIPNPLYPWFLANATLLQQAVKSATSPATAQPRLEANEFATSASSPATFKPLALTRVEDSRLGEANFVAISNLLTKS